MTYLIILYATYNDGKDAKKAMYTAEDYASAIASFHGYMSTYMKDSTVAHVMCKVCNVNGIDQKMESWDRPTEE